MPISIPRLRRWFVLAAIAASLVVAGVYLHRRRQVREVLKHIPGKMNVDIQQTAEGFKVSKSAGGRTIFTIQAKKVVQFKLGGRAELSNVTITCMAATPAAMTRSMGMTSPTTRNRAMLQPKAKSASIWKPIPRGCSSLISRAHCAEEPDTPGYPRPDVQPENRQRVHGREGRTRDAADVGVGHGCALHAGDNVLTLESQVDLALAGSGQTKLTAARGVISKTPRQVVLESARISHGPQQIQAQRATLYLRDDNTVDHVLASDGVEADLPGDSPLHARAAQAELKVNQAQDGLSVAVLTGNVQVESAGERPSRASAGRVVVDFAARNLVRKIRAQDNVKLIELPARVLGKPATNANELKSARPS